MAEPLTSDDILRERMGFGVSPLASQATREAYAGAGLSPLDTHARERFAAGAGLPTMTSQADKDAWMMAEHMAGKREEAPIAYGGLGDRPVGGSRRARRMQDEWDKKKAEIIDRESKIQGMEMAQREYDIKRRRFEMDEAASRLAADRQEEVEKQGQSIMQSIVGATLPDGTRLRPINIHDEDAVERLQSLAATNRLGMENPSARSALEMMLKDATDIRNAQLQLSQAQELEAANISAQSGNPFGQMGTYTESGIFHPDLSAVAQTKKELKEEESQKAEDRTIRTEERRAKAAAESRVGSEIKTQARGILKEIDKTDSAIRKANFEASQTKSKTEQKALKDKVDFLMGERDVLVGRINSLFPEETQRFNTIEEAQASGLPSGTVIYIGDRKARID